MSSLLAHGAALAARVAACCLLALLATAHAQESEDVFGDQSLSPEFTAPADESIDSGAELHDPGAAEFDQWEPLVESDSMLAPTDAPPADLRPFDWMRHWGFHHSSTEGRFMDKGLAMERSSWLNRPYHLDWFVGPLLSDGPVDGRVSQSNELFGGLRLGWDFDYYWGVEWRFGWADPHLIADDIDTELSGTYFVSDVDFVYYPWGDTKVRPYVQWGLGLTEIGSVRPDGSGQEATLLSMPMGIGVRFPQTHWLAWRLEVIDNLAFGADGVDTMNNFAFTAGMELRMGARPNSYWPWRSSRTIW
jgi:hypothetical protein